MKQFFFIFLLFACCEGFCQNNDSTTHPTFKVQKKAPYYATIGGLAKGQTSYQIILDAGKITINGCEDCQIIGFDMQTTASTNKDSLAHSNNTMLNDKMRKMIKKIKRRKDQGSYVLFCNIKYTALDGNVMTLNDIRLFVESKHYRVCTQVTKFL
jgi:hypothetical protein